MPTSSDRPESDGTRRIIAVLATYQDRATMLEAVLDRLRDEGVTQAVVVDTGASWPVAERLAARFGAFVDIVAMGGNRGCALGYGHGIERALALGADMVWLLDDDNRPTPGSFAALIAAWTAELENGPGRVGRDRLVVTAVRDEHHADVLAGVPERHLRIRWNSFGGFHVRDFAYKLWRRTPFGRPSGRAPSTARVDVTPYGGALFHRSVVARFGLPLPDFYQYGDDTEFMWRITRDEGRILVVTAARIEDLEASWNPTVQLSNRFRGLVAGSSGFRTYYSVRNAAYFESRFRCRNRVMFELNRLAYLGLVFVYARRIGHPERYRLIREAIADGQAGRLSINPRYRLP